jgi:galactose mutarotase-like enzyme
MFPEEFSASRLEKMMPIYLSEYKSLKSIVLENGKLKVSILPDQGAKVCSIIDKSLNKEFLWQNHDIQYHMGEYDGSFDRGDMSGFDEMFPSIGKCKYLKKPWQDISIPDHGEVWPLQWNYRFSKEQVILWTFGVRFPYQILKKVALAGNSICFKYTLLNLSQFDFDFIWAAHPLFIANEDMEIMLPASVEQIINVCEFDDMFDSHKRIHSWPVARGANGELINLNKMLAKDAKKCRKFYSYEKLKRGWSAIYDQANQYAIEFQFPVSKVPYIGIWMDAYGFPLRPQYNLALEPSTGRCDSLETLQQDNDCTTIKSKSKYTWWLRLSAGNVREIDSLEEKVIFR